MNTENNKKSKNWILYMVLYYVAAIAINIIGSTIVTQTGIPLYLDTAGTFLAAVYGGYVPGIIVAFTTTIFKSITDHEAMYYNVVGIFMGICAAFFASKGFFKKNWKALLTLPAYAIVAGVPDTIITWFLDTSDVGQQYKGLEKFLINNAELSRFPAKMLTEISTEFIDKGFSLIIALIIMQLLPKKLINRSKPNGLWQSPLTADMKSAIRKNQCRSVSQRTKIVLVITAASLLIADTSVTISSFLYRRSNIADKETLAEGLASIAAENIDAERVEEYLLIGENAEDYNDTEHQLQLLLDAYNDVEYVYVYKIEEDGCHVVFEVAADSSNAEDAGTLIEFDDSFNDLIPDLLAGKEIDPIITDDSYGWLLTAYKPVYDKNGNCVCYAAADVSMDDIAVYEYSFMTKLISLLLAFYLLIVALAMWLIKHNLLLPVNTMAYCAGAFAYNSDEALENSVKRLKSLDIHTGDEIENLYHAFLKTTEDTMSHINDIQTKNKTISKMQNGLIMVLADMVESRDKCTGDHVRKTAAYVKIIMEEMKKENIYADQLTDEFIRNVKNAAPLHDIGKISVSDTILNKPDKLTDEEFVIMKTHTTLGSEIIERVIDMVPDTGYLAEAKRLSEYHHEKWNGKGYPHGISGEEIPLSARIMAVADVFDALVSRRSYKEPFTFEKAMDIIRKDAGVHFDPLVAQAFINAEDRVRQVAEEFNSVNKIS